MDWYMYVKQKSIYSLQFFTNKCIPNNHTPSFRCCTILKHKQYLQKNFNDVSDYSQKIQGCFIFYAFEISGWGFMWCMHVIGQFDFSVFTIYSLLFLNFECTSKMMIGKFSEKLKYKLNVQASWFHFHIIVGLSADIIPSLIYQFT